MPGFEDAFGTAKMLIFFDKLFDSFNGSSLHSNSNTNLRCRMSSDSEHLEFWRSAKQILRSVKFECPKTKKVTQPPTIKNWLHTIKGMEYLWKKLQDMGFTYLKNRSFNQDSVEKFFGLIRSHGARNVNPTCSAFIASYRTLIINNFLSSKSVGTNCEDNLSNSGLDNFRAMLSCPFTDTSSSTSHTSLSISVASSTEDICATYAKTYVCGYFAKKLLRMTNQCNDCYKIFVTNDELPEHELLLRKQSVNRQQLIMPNSSFMRLYNECSKVICNNLPKLCLVNGIASTLKQKLMDAVDINTLPFCNIHGDIKKQFIDLLIPFIIFSWVSDINRILKGKDTRLGIRNTDPIKRIAHLWYIKHK